MTTAVSLNRSDRSERSDRSIPTELKLAVLLIVTIAFGWLNIMFATRMYGMEKDYGIFRESAEAFLAGQDMYGIARIGENLNPPHFMLLVLPLARLSPVNGWAIWLVAGAISLVVSLATIFRNLNVRLTSWQIWTLLALALAFAGTGATLILGQVAWVMMLPFTFAWLEMRRGRWVAAGVWLGVCASVKLFALIFLPYLIVKRRWQALASMMGTIACVIATGVAFFGVDEYVSWINAMGTVTWYFLPMNASIQGFLERSLSMNAPTAKEHLEPVVLASWLIRPLWLVGAGAVGLISLLRLRTPSHDSAAEIDRAFLLFSLAALLASPLGWIYYGWLFAGPALAVMLRWWNGETARRWLVIALIAGVCWPLPAMTLFQPHGWATVTFGSIYFWSILVMWGVLIVGGDGVQSQTSCC